VPKNTETDRKITNSVDSEFQTVGPATEKAPEAECNSPSARYSQLYRTISKWRVWEGRGWLVL